MQTPFIPYLSDPLAPIEDVAREMVELTEGHHITVVTLFRGVPLKATTGMSPKKIVERYLFLKPR